MNPEEQITGTTEENGASSGTTDDSGLDTTIPATDTGTDVRTMTVIDSEKGKINVIHEITIGDLLVSTTLLAMLIFMVLSRVIRRG